MAVPRADYLGCFRGVVGGVQVCVLFSVRGIIIPYFSENASKEVVHGESLWYQIPSKIGVGDVN